MNVRTALKILGVVVLLLALVAVGGVLYLRTALPAYEGRVTLAGLAGPVDVGWDSLGIPHVRAGSMEDLAFTQGWLHARDRLWQMELMRRVAAGRLAEVLGGELEPTDRFLRTLGLWRATADAAGRLDPTVRRWYDAYVAGVNARIADPRGALPPEFVVLGFRPEPWTLRHSLSIEKVMSLSLSSYEHGAEMTGALSALGRERARHLLVDYPAWGAHIQGGPRPLAVPPTAAMLLDGFSVASASNAWAVAGARTTSGKPILANDPHLELRSPSIWYLMALHASGGGAVDSAGPIGRLALRDLDVAGATLPGTPLVVLGHNRAIAWGMTNAYVDDADFFIERLDPADPTRYLTPDGSRPFEVVPETLWVKGRDEPVLFDVRRTRHGPVMTEAEDRLGDEVIAVQWTALAPTGTATALAMLNLARDWDEVVAAVDRFDDPHQNVVYADTAGNIGYYMGGTVSLRANGARPPVLPVPGWDGAWDWSGALPIERHPHALNPERGYVVTANNRQAAGEVGDLVSTDWQEPFRAVRIEEMIEAAGIMDVDAVHRMQLDVRDALAVRYLDRAIRAAEAAGLDERVRMLQDWEGDATADSRAAAYFYNWYERLRADLAADLYGRPGGYFPRNPMMSILESRAVPWREDPEAAFRSLAEEAARRADDAVGERRWSELNRVAHAHALGQVGILERTLGLNIGPVGHHGSPTTVNVAHYALMFPAGPVPWTTRAGPSLRHVVDMAALDERGGFIIGTGQSGLPFSGHYADQFRAWRTGGLSAIPLTRAAAEASLVQWLRLESGQADG